MIKQLQLAAAIKAMPGKLQKISYLEEFNGVLEQRSSKTKCGSLMTKHVDSDNGWDKSGSRILL